MRISSASAIFSPIASVLNEDHVYNVSTYAALSTVCNETTTGNEINGVTEPVRFDADDTHHKIDISAAVVCLVECV